ncbi:hypothetical protein AZE42_13439 [Rhizopogon vesiculosus]|uniref:Uncharacterized protein n=1 Tax=Rhizopogon vesiculosus TaxID=180088 RepID=A0A1J8PP35_9AGAM|nr:hypothetical protein AZE42_13439 [Rhizopogon vesiculosus]
MPSPEIGTAHIPKERWQPSYSAPLAAEQDKQNTASFRFSHPQQPLQSPDHLYYPCLIVLSIALHSLPISDLLVHPFISCSQLPHSAFITLENHAFHVLHSHIHIL